MRAWIVTGIYIAVLFAVHLVVTRGTGTLPDATRELVGASAASMKNRLWAQGTALWFHDSWFHITYNSTLLLLTLPFVLDTYGTKALGFMLVSSPIAAILVNLLLILPTAALGWGYAEEAAGKRVVGASIVVFAGIGLALMAAPPLWSIGIVAALVVYELILACTGKTGPMVAAYHLGGLALGMGWALALTRASGASG